MQKKKKLSKRELIRMYLHMKEVGFALTDNNAEISVFETYTYVCTSIYEMAKLK